MLRRLSVRVIAASTLLAALALLVVAIIITDLYRSAIERRFDALLSAHLFSLVAGTDVTDANRLVGAPQIGDARYGQPGSGWLWEVVPASPAVSGRLASPFLAVTLDTPPVSDVPFDASFERRYRVNYVGDAQLRVIETEVVLGNADAIARFRVMGNLNEVEAEVSGFMRKIALYLGLAGLAMIAVNALAMVFALRPLNAARDALGRVRAGEAEELDGDFPVEIEPLAEEINALIDNNRRIVDRARVQVGDLAHALKTPLAVITNEVGGVGGEPGRIVAEQAGLMRRQIDHYLQRARFAAQKGTVAYRTDAGPVVAKLVRVFGKLNPERALEFSPPASRLLFAGEAQDLEEIAGNLLENAAKWAAGTIRVTLALHDAQHLMLRIEDDGPGIAPERHDDALKRGRRLDETKPGTGLGLSIVAELVREYRGTISLGRSPLGGLDVTVALPLAPA